MRRSPLPLLLAALTTSWLFAVPSKEGVTDYEGAFQKRLGAEALIFTEPRRLQQATWPLKRPL